MVHEIEDFFGVYLLLCLNPRYKGRTYIGYTVDPNRRIKQHNTGSHAGGAFRTSGRGPWEMVLIIHGFPNNISALRFEWAWQHPHKFLSLKHVPVVKRSSETAYQHRWRIVCHMLRSPPWSRLALNVRWLKQDHQLDFPSNLEPPSHMPVVFGPVRSKKIQGKQNDKGSPRKKSSSSPAQQHPHTADTDMEDEDCLIPTVVKKNPLCSVCHQKLKTDSQRLSCFWPGCSMVSHMSCLAQRFLGNDLDHLIPVEGPCPGCKRSVLWGDLIRHFKGCYQNMATCNPEVFDGGSQDESPDGHWADDLKS
ncbi:structure-specific endonuclease subunit slx1-like [Littorina saxatilis]|uniref:Structure-specific endonuclease subunit SLX1 homolog n=1 Tax=Littorina saxatilis TaxID=31220 RepID=A0AAN9AIC2_9CAEN